MLVYCLTFTLGVYSLYWCQELPPAEFFVLCTGTLVFLQFARRCLLPAVFLSGMAVASCSAGEALEQRLQQNSSDQVVLLNGVVADFPVHREHAVRFDFRPINPGLPRVVRLTWYEPGFTPELGQLLALKARLRAPRGFANPGQFDYEGWLLHNGIGATGYVVAGEAATGADVSWRNWLPAVRKRLARRIENLLPDDNARAVIFALVLGARHEMDSELWEDFARTGTSHLVAISGLHIGLVAGGVYLLFRWILLPFRHHLSVHKAAWLLALLVATGYALVSGFGVPSRRAVVMLGLMCTWRLIDRELAAGQWLSMALVLTLLIDPLSAMSSGYMLSFAAVITLLLTARADASLPILARQRVTARLRELARVQVVLCLVLLPLTAALFGRGSLVASLVNLLLLPLFSLVIVPMSLLGTVLADTAVPAANLSLILAWAMCGFALELIRLVADQPIAGFYPATPGLAGTLFNMLTIAWVLLPAGFPGRGLALLAFLHLCLFRPERPEDGCVQTDILDVGQGQAIVLRTRSKNLVYDTGPRFRTGGDTGRLVVLPFLRSVGVSRLDRLVVSHGDLDHAGGVASVLESLPVSSLQSGEPQRIRAEGARRCRTGDSWIWDGVSFNMLAPAFGLAVEGNNASCVLLVSAGDQRLLLTGDIERPVEEYLLRSGVLPQVNVVTIPHHGSRTSSSAALVSRLRPKLAIASTGYENRWGFPKPDIVRRWKFAGSRVLSTAKSGAISVSLCNDKPAGRLSESRQEWQRFWNAH